MAAVGRSRVSAGILLYRRGAGGQELLIGHPGGPYFARKDAGHWSIPKGEVDGEEDLEARTAEFPEIDRVAWCSPAEARRLLKPTQHPLIDRLDPPAG